MTIAEPPAKATPELDALITRAQELYDDLEFKAVKEWKQAGENRKAVAFLPVYVPREIIHAAGALPVGVLGAGDQLEVVRGDSYFQSYICHLPRSVIELGLSGRLNQMDGFLFPSICDVIRNLSGMFKLKIGDAKFIHYLDLPQNFNPKLGGKFYQLEMDKVAKGVSKLTGIEVTDDRLRNSIAVYNKNREVIRRMVQARVDR
ncbi:MAG: 2-hydroxyacyl-CoA dehydratase family protein, partial [Nitrospira sp.]|nr:2-hydroxyacyl-CoA dehydratase family protein [Nitrospira sp.]